MSHDRLYVSDDGRAIVDAIDRAADVGRDLVQAILAHKPHRSESSPLSTWPGFASNVPRCRECSAWVYEGRADEVGRCAAATVGRCAAATGDAYWTPAGFSCGLWRPRSGDPPGTFNGYTDH